MNILAIIEKTVQKKLEKEPPGVFSICSANPLILKCCMQIARKHNFPLIIETTCNQVNQYGGYTHLTPDDFSKSIQKMACENGLAQDQVFLGGDHIGPFVWAKEPAEIAMEKSIELVVQYVRAGYKKIHLDASMPCLDDLSPLSQELVVMREARLCQAAVKENKSLGRDLSDLVFVLGTEVPAAGGSVYDQEDIDVSSVEETEENIQLTRQVFTNYNLNAAWERTLAFVVQPGVEFSDTNIHSYNRKKANKLSRLIEKYDHLVFEAHSTDYQTRKALRELVVDHFSFLKVGPALTFALRETLFALYEIENELIGREEIPLSNLKQVLEKVMLSNPEHWKKYYSDDAKEGLFQRKYSLLDRSRYYFSHPEVEKSQQLLISNLSQKTIPYSLISQYLPDQARKVKEGLIPNHPLELISGKIEDVVENYLYACNMV